MPANVENMFYVGEMPWHKEGTKLNSPPNTAAAIKAAGLDWSVTKVKLYSEYKSLVKDYFGIMRTDNNEVLGVVGKGYVPLQNSDAFNVFDPFISDKFLEYETAGSIGSGEIIWILARLKKKGEMKVHNDDIVKKYLLLSNSHDGKSAVSIKFTPIRVVCQNTLSIALSQGETTRIKHITNMNKKLDDIQGDIQNILTIYSSIEDVFTKMVNYQMTLDKLHAYFNGLYPVVKEEDIKTNSQWNIRNQNINIQNQLLKNFVEGIGVKELGIGGSLWAAYNAVTQFIDHPVNYKLGDNKLLKRIWFGDGELIKKKAYIDALEYLKTA